VGAKEFSIFLFLFSFFPLVSIPLRGKEGGEKKKKEERRMKTGCWHGLWGPTSFLFSFFYFRFFPWFPSPCGVRRVRDTYQAPLGVYDQFELFPSPCGVRRVRDIMQYSEFRPTGFEFPSPCGVRRVRDLNRVILLPSYPSFRPLAG
jgi:hypothetical protein